MRSLRQTTRGEFNRRERRERKEQDRMRPRTVDADSDESGHLFRFVSDSIPGLAGQLSERSDAGAQS